LSIVSAAPVVASRRPRLAAWALTALRSGLALVLGLIITFTGAHSAGFGLVAFGAYGVLAGVVLLAGALLTLARAVRGAFLVQAVVTIAAGIAGLALAGGDVIALVGVVSVFALLTGALELITGIRTRRTERSARDSIIVGALTLLLGLAFLLVPPGYSQDLGGIEKIAGTLTAPVILVGLLGAWGILVGVLLAISAVSLRTPTTGDDAPSPEDAA
jgi:uncharacterized membrane protein HdeD (DUF308 family)